MVVLRPSLSMSAETPSSIQVAEWLCDFSRSNKTSTPVATSHPSEKRQQPATHRAQPQPSQQKPKWKFHLRTPKAYGIYYQDAIQAEKQTSEEDGVRQSGAVKHSLICPSSTTDNHDRGGNSNFSHPTRPNPVESRDHAQPGSLDCNLPPNFSLVEKETLLPNRKSPAPCGIPSPKHDPPSIVNSEEGFSECTDNASVAQCGWSPITNDSGIDVRSSSVEPTFVGEKLSADTPRLAEINPTSGSYSSEVVSHAVTIGRGRECCELPAATCPDPIVCSSTHTSSESTSTSRSSSLSVSDSNTGSSSGLACSREQSKLCSLCGEILTPDHFIAHISGTNHQTTASTQQPQQEETGTSTAGFNISRDVECGASSASQVSGQQLQSQPLCMPTSMVSSTMISTPRTTTSYQPILPRPQLTRQEILRGMHRQRYAAIQARYPLLRQESSAHVSTREGHRFSRPAIPRVSTQHRTQQLRRTPKEISFDHPAINPPGLLKHRKPKPVGLNTPKSLPRKDVHQEDADGVAFPSSPTPELSKSKTALLQPPPHPSASLISDLDCQQTMSNKDLSVYDATVSNTAGDDAMVTDDREHVIDLLSPSSSPGSPPALVSM